MSEEQERITCVEEAITSHNDRLKILEEHDIFKVWLSIRKGGKTTLGAMLNNNRGIKDLTDMFHEQNNKLGEYSIQIAELEKKLESLKPFKANDIELLFKERKQIAELREGLATIDNAYQSFDLGINELKEHNKKLLDKIDWNTANINELKEELKGCKLSIGNNTSNLGLWVLKWGIIKEVFQDHVNAHKYIADQGSEIKIMDKWVEHLNTVLEKLDSKSPNLEGKTEKKDHFKTIDGKIVEFGYGLKKDSVDEKIPIGEDLLERIRKVKSVPMDKSKLREKELYELYLKDGGQYYFRKITHPFTEYNNMVHLAIGKIVVNRSDKQELIEKFQANLLSIHEEPELLGVRMLCKQYSDEWQERVKK